MSANHQDEDFLKSILELIAMTKELINQNKALQSEIIEYKDALSISVKELIRLADLLNKQPC